MNKRSPVVKEEMRKDIEKLIKICHHNLKNSQECTSYLVSDRGMSEDMIAKYEIGFFPQNVDKLAKFVSRATLEKLNIVRYSGGSKFSEFFYLIFPIYSEYSEGIGIGGRTLLNADQRSVFEIPKYENSSFRKAQILFGLNHSRGSILKEQNVYVTEGYFDHIALDAAGIKNSVAICGTAFSKNHFIKLARYTDKITFVLDRDDGGQKSMERIAAKYMNRGVKLRFKLLPEEFKDVDEFFSSGKSGDDFVNELETYIPGW